jgi:exonuclease III
MTINILDYIKNKKCKQFNQIKFDIVYTYVNSRDKKWQKKIKKYAPDKNIDIQRYKDYGEIYFSLKTLEIYGKSICKNIFIVTDNQKIDETKISSWIKTRIKYIYHTDIIPKKYLPTFNSITIESFLHNIPDITENFIYLNDDMFFGNFVTSKYFYNKNNCLNILVRSIKKASPKSNNRPWLDYYLNGYDVFIKKYDIFPNIAPMHTYYMMNKEICRKTWKRFEKDLDKSMSMIRNKHNINFWFLCFAMGLYKGYFANKLPTNGESMVITCHPNMTEEAKKKDLDSVMNNRPNFFCYNNINPDCEKYWKILKNEYLVSEMKTTKLKVITLNILSHQYTNFARGSKTEKESIEEMKLRYVKLGWLLLKRNVDIICLQEVDKLAYKYLSNKFKKNGYDFFYSFNDPHNGVLTIWKNNYKSSQQFKKNITKNYHGKDNTYPFKNKKQIVSFVTLNINGKSVRIGNTRLWGHPDRIDVRLDELDNIINIGSDRVILCGDFNETDYKKIIDHTSPIFKTYDEYFKISKFATSYHPWNLNRKTQEMYAEPRDQRYKSVDYLLYTPSIECISYKSYPTKHGVYKVDEPYKNTTDKYTVDMWPSDHAMIEFIIKV